MNTLSSILNFIGRGLPPIGSIEIFAGSSSKVPSGWLLCNGATVSRTTYDKLFSVIGETYGAGNGSTTFKIPNLSGRVPVGANSTYALASTGGSANAVIPYHRHSIAERTISGGSHDHKLGRRNVYTATGSAAAVVTYGGGTANDSETGSATHTHTLSAHYTEYAGTSGNTSGANMQPYISLNYIIRAE